MRLNKIFKHFVGTIEEVKYQMALFESENNVIAREDVHEDWENEPASVSITYSIQEKDT